MPVLAAEQEIQPFIRELWDKHKVKCVGNTVSNIVQLIAKLPGNKDQKGQTLQITTKY